MTSYTCGCGEPADKISSGTAECWRCWTWRKIDGPAARHWQKVGTEFLSNIDMHDLTSYFDRAGFSPTALGEIRSLVEYSTREIEAHGPPPASCTPNCRWCELHPTQAHRTEGAPCDIAP